MMGRNRIMFIVTDECAVACETPENDAGKLELYQAMCRYGLHGTEPHIRDDQLSYLFESTIRPQVDMRIKQNNHNGCRLSEALHPRAKVSPSETPAIDALLADRLGGAA